jgi:hypothetical protein
MPTTYCLTRSEYVTVREHSPDALVVEVEYAPGRAPATPLPPGPRTSTSRSSSGLSCRGEREGAHAACG